MNDVRRWCGAVGWLALGLVCWGGEGRAETKEKWEGGRPRYEVTVELDYQRGRFRGEEVLRWRNGTGEAVESLYFHLYPNVGSVGVGESVLPLRVERVTARGRDLRYSYRARGGGLRVDFDERIGPGREVELELVIVGELYRTQREESSLLAHFLQEVDDALEEESGKRPGMDARDIYFAGEDALLLGHFFPLLAPRAQALDEVKFPLGAHRALFVEVADYDVTIGVDRGGVLVVGSGEEVEVRTRDAGSRHRFRLRGGRGFAVAVAAQMRSIEQRVGGQRTVSHFREGDRRPGERALTIASRALAIYGESFGLLPGPLHGPLPWTTVQVVELPLTAGYSVVSFPGLIVLAQAYYVDVEAPESSHLPGVIREQADVIRSSFEFLLAQSLARQWWGGVVGSDVERSPFIGDGLATFSAFFYHQAAYGRPLGEVVLQRHIRGIYQAFRMLGGSDQEVERPLREFRSALEYAAIVEAKGALFYVQLRQLLGDDLFFRFLRGYYDEHRQRVASVEQWRQRLQSAGGDPRMVRQLQQRWLREKRGDEEIGAPDLTLVPAPVSRIRSLGRLFLRIGKTAARPF